MSNKFKVCCIYPGIAFVHFIYQLMVNKIDFHFEIVSFPFPDEDVTHSTSSGTYIHVLYNVFARLCSNVIDSNSRSKC